MTNASMAVSAVTCGGMPTESSGSTMAVSATANRLKTTFCTFLALVGEHEHAGHFAAGSAVSGIRTSGAARWGTRSSPSNP